MKRSLLTAVAIILLFSLVLSVLSSLWTSSGLRYIEQVRHERDALYQRFAEPINGAHDYAEAFQLFKEVPTSTVQQDIQHIVEHGWKEPSQGVTEWLEANARAMERIRDGNAKPMHLMPRLERAEDALPAQPSTIRWLSYLFIATGKRAEARGEMNVALQAYLDAIRFGYALETDRTVIDKAMGIAIRKLGFAALRALSPQVRDPQALVTLLNELGGSEESAVPLAELFKSELLGITHEAEKFYQTHPNLANPLWGWYLGKRRALGYLTGVYLHLVQQSSLPYPHLERSGGLRPYYRFSENPTLNIWLMLDNPIGKLLAAIALPSFEAAPRVCAEAQAGVRATQLTLALALFKLQHGEFPKELSELQSLVASTSLQDPFSDGVFHYQRQDHGYLLYSVGPDLGDDGGKVQYDDTHRHGSDLLYSLSLPASNAF